VRGALQDGRERGHVLRFEKRGDLRIDGDNGVELPEDPGHEAVLRDCLPFGRGRVTAGVKRQHAFSPWQKRTEQTQKQQAGTEGASNMEVQDVGALAQEEQGGLKSVFRIEYVVFR